MIASAWIISFEKKGYKMIVKNVLKGLRQKWDLQEINIISPAESKVYYSGTVEGWDNTDKCLLAHKRKVENAEVMERIMFNGRKVFIFISPLDCFYPQNVYGCVSEEDVELSPLHDDYIREEYR